MYCAGRVKRLREEDDGLDVKEACHSPFDSNEDYVLKPGEDGYVLEKLIGLKAEEVQQGSEVMKEVIGSVQRNGMEALMPILDCAIEQQRKVKLYAQFLGGLLADFSDILQQFLGYVCDTLEEAASDGCVFRAESILVFLNALTQAEVVELKSFTAVMQASSEAGLHLPTERPNEQDAASGGLLLRPVSLSVGQYVVPHDISKINRNFPRLVIQADMMPDAAFGDLGLDKALYRAQLCDAEIYDQAFQASEREIKEAGVKTREQLAVFRCLQLA